MNSDLNIIKKKYGEKMSHLCRKLFSSLLESEGLLSKLLLDNFHESHYLYQDIVDNGLENAFKNYICSLVDVKENNEVIVTKTPEELMSEASYILYECRCEEDIQKFKRYYARGEELCTFNENRLDRCHVFFAVKKNVDEVRRDKFESPKREDEYGRSVISIQFTKDSSHTLSIKNRYNHMVNNPDATFSNNLDNIIPGLTDSFAKHYGMVQSNYSNNFDIPSYVRASDGKYYKYNYEINNICYCCDNIIIDYFKVKKYDKSKYLVIDYFIIDLVNKKIELYDKKIDDCFIDCVTNIKKINVINISNGKKIEIIDDNDKVFNIYVDTYGKIIKLNSKDINVVGNRFLCYNTSLTDLYFSNLEFVGNRFLNNNTLLRKIELPKLISVGNSFLVNNLRLTEINFEKLEDVGDNFLKFNEVINKLSLPNLNTVGSEFLCFNKELMEVSLPSLEIVKNNFLNNNNILTFLNVPKLVRVSNHFLHSNKLLKRLVMPNLINVGDGFMFCNENLEVLDLPELEYVGNYFLFNNKEVTYLELLKLRCVGYCFMYKNCKLSEVNLPNLEDIGGKFLSNSRKKVLIKKFVEVLVE